MMSRSDSKNGECSKFEDDEECEINRTLYCANVPSESCNNELYELFLQAGPLEKVCIPQGKSMAFITFKHSVSVPYAKRIFCDTKLHGRFLRLNFRSGSLHDKKEKQQRDRRHEDHRDDRYTPQYVQANYYRRDNHREREMSRHKPQTLMQAPTQPIASYHSSNNAQYEPLYISFQNPPAEFLGGPSQYDPNNVEAARRHIEAQQKYYASHHRSSKSSHHSHHYRR